MIRFAASAIAVLFCLFLGAAQLVGGSAFAQGAEQNNSAPRSAWPSAAPSEQGTPKSAWPARPSAGAPPGTATSSRSYGGWWRFVMETQRNFFRQMGEAVKKFKAGGSLSASWALIAVSFLYGVFHAVGPGHGKAVISSYVLANGATVRRGIALSFLAALVQALSAIIIVSILAVALNAAGIEIKKVAQRFELASGALITLAGLWLLTAYIRRRFLSQASTAPDKHTHEGQPPDHVHDENCGCGHAHMPDAREIGTDWSLRKAAAIVLAVGIRPCSGAIFILVFALTQGIYWAGIGATFAMSAGTAITVSTLAVGAVLFRNLTLRYAASRWTSGLYDFAAIAGSCLVIFFGLGLFLDSLGPVRPF